MQVVASVIIIIIIAVHLWLYYACIILSTISEASRINANASIAGIADHEQEKEIIN